MITTAIIGVIVGVTIGVAVPAVGNYLDKSRETDGVWKAMWFVTIPWCGFGGLVSGLVIGWWQS